MDALKFDRALFWDIDPDTLDIKKHSKFIIRRVLQYGSIEDWEKIKNIFGLNKIVSTAKTIKDLDKKTASFLSVIGNVPKNDFICYTTKPSTPKHWNF
ncbi:MAG: hypothetical protein L3J34_09545 [Flavobacteriaceae bacterium]|nr:hypothetical protein [Flavobacteriaceae bacterium]